MEQGLIHIYCGDGKGKTSAAIGLAVRAAGSGLKVLFTRFLKNESSGELAILDDISQIKVLHLEKSYGFFKNLSEEKKQEVRETYLRLWRAIELEILTGRYDVLVIDEFMAAYKYDLIPKEEAQDRDFRWDIRPEVVRQRRQKRQQRCYCREKRFAR